MTAVGGATMKGLLAQVGCARPAAGASEAPASTLVGGMGSRSKGGRQPGLEEELEEAGERAGNEPCHLRTSNCPALRATPVSCRQ